MGKSPAYLAGPVAPVWIWREIAAAALLFPAAAAPPFTTPQLHVRRGGGDPAGIGNPMWPYLVADDTSLCVPVVFGRGVPQQLMAGWVLLHRSPIHQLSLSLDRRKRSQSLATTVSGKLW